VAWPVAYFGVPLDYGTAEVTPKAQFRLRKDLRAAPQNDLWHTVVVGNQALGTQVGTQPGKRPDLLKILLPYDSGKYLVGPGNVEVDVGRFAFAGGSLADTGDDTADGGVLPLVFPGLRSSQSLAVAEGGPEKQDGCWQERSHGCPGSNIIQTAMDYTYLVRFFSKVQAPETKIRHADHRCADRDVEL